MRQCSRCRASDRPEFSGDVCSCGIKGTADEHMPDCSGIAHYVQRELKWLKSERDVPKGWKYMFFQGRYAAERLSCIECLRKDEDARLIQRELQKARESINGGNLTHHQIYTA